MIAIGLNYTRRTGSLMRQSLIGSRGGLASPAVLARAKLTAQSFGIGLGLGPIIAHRFRGWSALPMASFGIL
jgi:hypothetical protein